LIDKFGKPHVTLCFAKVEAKTGSTAMPTIQVERFVEAKLKFRDDIIISNVKKSFAMMIDNNGIVVKYVRLPTYNPAKMVKATDSEINQNMTILNR
jgi:hypothetical protein